MIGKENKGKRKRFTHISKENTKIITEYVIYRTAKKTLEMKSQRNVKIALEKLADHLGKKSLKDATKEDLVDYFGDTKIFDQHNRSRDSNAVLIIPFYRWVEGIEDKTRPSNMKWYEGQTNQQKRRYLDPQRKEKDLITVEDYEKIITASNDAYGQEKALWETMYLSGARPNEIAQLKIKDVTEEKDGNYTIMIDQGNSKTIPRKIPLPEQPYNLIRWLGTHPLKADKKASLWMSLKTSEKIDTQNGEFITRRFTALKEKVSIKKTLLPKSFRKTRATILFQDKNYNDGDIAKIMGWTPMTVAQRRVEYDLTDFDDLKKKVFAKPRLSISYDELDKQKKTMEQKHEKDIQDLKKRIAGLDKINKKFRVPMDFLEAFANVLYIQVEYWLDDLKKGNKSFWTGKEDILYKAVSLLKDDGIKQFKEYNDQKKKKQKRKKNKNQLMTEVSLRGDRPREMGAKTPLPGNTL
ncbi:MAG: tyrosine-type recombinase/integrase [Euryarchaeota archaeon]|nr:tyrosine-type recombinase/integrase [Euryarchaeota archaeon]